MCGLTLSITPFNTTAPSIDRIVHSLHTTNAARGPNAKGVYARRFQTPAGDVLVTLGASVLGLRGTLTAQPLVGKRGVLAWNGQVFGGLDVGITENDTRKIFQRLEQGEAPNKVFNSIEGPYTFVYISFASRAIFFGVDPLSRRSLLLHAGDEDSHPTFILTSSRSAEARLQGVAMRTLDGGQTGVIDLTALPTGMLDFSAALKIETRSDIAPVNKATPPADPGTAAAEAECDTFIARLEGAVRRRVENIPERSPGSARVALLFSGGVDCSLLAALVHRCLPAGEPIELVNVAFEQPRAKENVNGNKKGKQRAPERNPYDVPDRVSGRDAVEELRGACPGRDFRFVQVDVDVEESRAHRQEILDLMYPNKTEMDLSLGYPLYFASRGVGVVDFGYGPVPYTVGAKVYISGLGADEQLGGYSRHRRAFERGAWPMLIDELQLDLDRLPQRNLSRDDRMLSSHARDARYPYLDLEFVRYVSSLPIWAKCYPLLPPGEGDKVLIRLGAQQCGLQVTGKRVKRAMQFGTKSAKLNEAPARGFGAGEVVVQD